MQTETLSGFDAYAGRRPGRAWWFSLVLGLVALASVPIFGDMAMQLDLSLALILSLLALSMGFMWGYVGMLSLGQTIFFGLGGYVYAIVSLNTQMEGLAFLAGVLLPMLFALLLGYFMIFGRISDIYFSVITLVVTLIFEKSVRATSGPEYVIGSVRLNGQNGIPGVPGLPWDIGPLSLQSIDGMFYLALFFLSLVYVGVRLFLTSTTGRILVGLRENETRMALQGYDARWYKLLAFVMAGGLAGLAGVLYAVWGNFVGTEMFSLNQAAMVVIWVIVGGRATLIGPIVGTLLIQYLTTWLGTVGVGQVSLGRCGTSVTGAGRNFDRMCAAVPPRFGADRAELGVLAGQIRGKSPWIARPFFRRVALVNTSGASKPWMILTLSWARANCAA